MFKLPLSPSLSLSLSRIRQINRAYSVCVFVRVRMKFKSFINFPLDSAHVVREPVADLFRTECCNIDLLVLVEVHYPASDAAAIDQR